MKLNQAQKSIVLTILCFSIYLYLKTFFAPIKESIDQFTHNGLTSYILTYLIIGTPIFIGTYLINYKHNIFYNLGLYPPILKSFAIALIFTLPMFIGGYLLFEFNPTFSIQNLIAGSIVIGFIEELFFRGFLFGQLFKYTKLGFISSIIIGAIVFASGHLYQSQDSIELIGIFAITFMGAVLFAWLYVEWNFNLWVPIFLHSLMNLSWHIFEMDDTALGGILPNIFRGLTIFTAIVFTIRYKRKQNLKLAITKDNLFFKKN